MALITGVATAQEAATTEGASGPTKDDEASWDTAHVQLEYLDSKTAVTVLRSIFQSRQIVEIEDTRTIVIRDSPRAVQEARALLAELDVPGPRWRMELWADVGGQELALREMPIEDETLRLHLGAADDAYLGLTIEPRGPGGAELSVSYSFQARIRYDPAVPPFGVSESGKATLGDGDQLELLKATQPGVDRVLASVLGQPAPVTRIFLSFRRLENR